MTDTLSLRHTVSIAGIVRKAAINNGPLPASPEEERNLDFKRRIEGAQIEIIVDEAPTAFQRMVAAKKADPFWIHQHERIDRTWSQSDGIFYFVNLPPGDSYRLRVTAPTKGTRYGMVESVAVTVSERPPDRPMLPVQVDMELPTTRIQGRITDTSTDLAEAAQPIAGALVRLRTDPKAVCTGRDGHYLLDGLVAGTWIVEIVPRGFQPSSHTVVLSAGQDVQLDVSMTPLP